MTKTMRAIAVAAMALAPFVAGRAQAQLTPEGTTITNTATASYTDANGNTYTNVTATASVIVGFLPGVDAASPATVTPASPSTGNSLAFTVTNTGNGTDSVNVAFSVPSGVAVTGYVVGGTTYTTLAELNAALSVLPVTQASTVTVTVIYTVAPGKGGSTMPLTMTAHSIRTPATQDPTTTNISPPVSAAVSVTPDGGTASRLPSNGTQYSETFVVTNNGNATDTYTLLGATTGGTLTLVSVNGTAGTGSSVTIAAGATANVTVVYTVANAAAAGTTAPLTLTATSTNNAAISDPGSYTITVVKAQLTMSKTAYKDDQTTTINGTTDRVLPGQYIQYKIAVTNAGTAAAQTISISDPLPSEVTYQSASGDAAGWTISTASGTVTGTLTGTLAPGATRYFWIRVLVK
ncbi:MAG: conserved repeat domain protein [Gemmatimonadetes bacterium]|nr:conserved repeat domain protein [Gemmatimonadota bacterium]